MKFTKITAAAMTLGVLSIMGFATAAQAQKVAVSIDIKKTIGVSAFSQGSADAFSIGVAFGPYVDAATSVTAFSDANSGVYTATAEAYALASSEPFLVMGDLQLQDEVTPFNNSSENDQ